MLAAERALEWLAELHWPHGGEEDIAHAIAAHSFSAGIPPETLEARVVQDADRLDALGAVGLTRVLQLSVELKRPLYDPMDPFCRHREPDDQRYAIDHFYSKLLKLESTMSTASGGSEAARRTVFLHEFLLQLANELQNALGLDPS